VVLGSGSVTDVVLEPFSVIMLTAPVPPPTTPFSLSTQNRNIIITAAPTPAAFTRADIALFNDADGAIDSGSVWSVVLNGQTFTYTAQAGDQLRHVAQALRDRINAVHPGLATVVERTRFKGDFGAALIRESEVHDSVFVAQDLDLAKWNDNASQVIAAETFVGETPDTWLPHLTVLATGNGDNDFYRFEVTADMLGLAGANGVKAVFDIDGGFDFGDAILWASRLTLHRGVFNEAGDLVGSTVVAYGPGYSHPFTGAGGSSTWLDDYLTYFVNEPGVYFVEVGKWYPFGPGGLPDGIDYELQVSIEAHKVDSFVFAPEAVLEKELENNSLLTPQDIDSLLNYFTFFDATVGNTDYPASSGSSRDVNFLTPTARVRGSGDGSFDVYSFEITPDMLASEGVSIDVARATAWSIRTVRSSRKWTWC
jgi:hypothetical protein